jgi:uncharacterized DUF497 family protein
MTTWDEAKRSSNYAKHGLDLADADRFDFQSALIEEDRDIRAEQRFRALGWIDERLCLLVFTMTGEDEIHAVSLRKADKGEARRYLREIFAAHKRRGR